MSAASGALRHQDRQGGPVQIKEGEVQVRID